MKRAFSLPSWVAIPGFLLAACVLAGALAWNAVSRSRRQHLLQAETSARNLCTVLADDIAKSYERVDLSLLAVKDEAERELASGGLDRRLIQPFIQRQHGRMPVLTTLRVAGADGWVVTGNEGVPEVPVQVGDRDYFARLKADPVPELVFSKPLMGRFRQEWVMILARRLNRADGSFGGIVYSSILLKEVAAHFSQLSIGTEGTVTLRDAELTVVARAGGNRDVTGQSTISREFQALRAAGAVEGTYSAVSTQDGVARIFAFTLLKPYNHYLHVGLGRKEVMAPWRRELRNTLAALAAFYGLIGASAGMVYRSWRRRRKAEADQLRAITSLKAAEGRLEETIAKLEQSNKDLEQFAFVASHDLRSPLRAIESLSLWLEEDLGPDLPEGSATNLHLLRSRVVRMEALLDGILAYSRVEDLEGATARVDVAALAEDIADLLQAHEHADLELKDLPVFQAAETPMRQVLQNLIDNAIKHRDGRRARITLAAEDLGAAYAFTVADQGPGIPEGFREKVFGLFQTLKSRDQVEGSGIGLAVVRRIVQRVGGRVWITSGKPRGTVVHFTWPKPGTAPEPFRLKGSARALNRISLANFRLHSW